MHFNQLFDGEMEVWVPKGMTFEKDLVKIVGIPYRGDSVLKVTTAVRMEGEGCGGN